MTGWITDDEAEKAHDWLMENAVKLGAAKSRVVLAEKMSKRIKALMMKKHSELSLGAQEREAEASDEMLAAYIEEAEATADYTTLLTYRDAATARMECWRTLSATQRALAK